MALANIIKEVDPPVELTQAEYDALSTAQKNDGTVYYITDGNGAFQTAATTPAEDTSGGTSNVQDELEKKVEKTDIVNNFTTTQEGYVADARALKTIADNYSLKTELANSTFQHITVPSDLNSMTTLWQYTDFTFAQTPSNAPYGAGTVYTLGGMSHVQVMFPYDFNQGTKFVFLRTRYANTWGAWYKVAVTAV